MTDKQFDRVVVRHHKRLAAIRREIEQALIECVTIETEIGVLRAGRDEYRQRWLRET